MSRTRVVLLTICLLCVLAAIAVRVGLPWYINSGRAAPRIEKLLADRLGATVQLDGLRMPAWLVVVAERLQAEQATGPAVTATNIRVGAGLWGLLWRRIGSVDVESILIRLPEGGAAVPSVPGKTGAAGPLPTIGRIVLEEMRIVRAAGPDGDETLAVLEMDATPGEAAQYDATFRVDVPLYAVNAAGTVRWRPGRRLPRLLEADFTGDWARLLALSGTPDLRGDGEVTGTVSLKEGVVTVRALRPAVHWQEMEVGPGEVTIAARPANLFLPIPMDVSLRAAQARYGETFAAPGAVEVRGRVEAAPVGRTVTWSGVEFEWDAGAVLQSSGEVSLATGIALATVDLPQLPLEVWAEYAAPVRRLTSGPTHVGGGVGATLTITAGPEGLAVDADSRWSDGSIMVDDFHQAGGIRMPVQIHVTPDADQGWRIEGNGAIESAEVLWDVLYLQARRVLPFTLLAWSHPEPASLTIERGTLDWGGLGQWRVAGTLPFGTDAEGLEVSGTDIELAAVVERLLVPMLSEARPWTADLVGEGRATFGMRATPTDAGPILRGRLQVAGGAVRDPSDRLGLRQLEIDVPFRLGPGATPTEAAPPEQGRIAFEAVRAGPAVLDGGVLPVQVWDNTGVVAAPYTTALFGGTLTVDAMWGRELFTPTRYWEAEVTLRNVDLQEATAAFQTIPLDGTLNGRLAPLQYAENTFDAIGNLEATVYGGALYLTRLGVLDVTSPYRTFTADVNWTGINLERATGALAFGRITGILDGWVRGLAVQSGEPAAFELEFHTVPTPGVPQTISIEAVNKISVLGTGRGLSGTLSRGLTAFFDSYRYEKIGFRCALEHDVFTVGGGAQGPEGEYFVLGTVLPPRINVIKRDPHATVSFSEMVQRVRALQLPTSGEAPATSEGVEES